MPQFENAIHQGSDMSVEEVPALTMMNAMKIIPVAFSSAASDVLTEWCFLVGTAVPWYR